MKHKNNIKENQQMRTKLMRLVAGAILATLFLPVGAENENGDNLPAGNEQKRGVNYSPNLLTASSRTSTTLGDDIDRHPGGFDFSIPLGKKRHSKGSTDLFMSGVGIGFVSAVGQKAPMDVTMGRSLEINWTEAIGLRYNFNRRNSLELAMGFLWRNYRMTHQYRFQQDAAEVLGVVPYPAGAVPKFSRLHIFQMTFPLMYDLNLKHGWHFVVGPELAVNGGCNSHTRTIKTRYSIDGEKYKEKTTDLRINPVSVNLIASIRFHFIGLYVRYSPCDVIDHNYGPKFQSLSAGFTLWGF